MPRKRRQKKEEEEMDDSWLLPYADMLTLLLALFIVLFAMSEVDVQKFKELSQVFSTELSHGAGLMDGGGPSVMEQAPGEDKDSRTEAEEEENVQGVKEYKQLKSIQERIEDYIATNSLTETLGTKLTSEGLLITVRTDITFDSGSAKVKQHGVEVAKEIATFLNTDPPHEIVINGHADDIPMDNNEFGSNWELSTMRAIEFMYLLLENADLPPKWFSARGYGEYRPVVENINEANRAINRRVEVLIQPNHDITKEVE